MFRTTPRVHKRFCELMWDRKIFNPKTVTSPPLFLKLQCFKAYHSVDQLNFMYIYSVLGCFNDVLMLCAVNNLLSILQTSCCMKYKSIHIYYNILMYVVCLALFTMKETGCQITMKEIGCQITMLFCLRIIISNLILHFCTRH